MLKSVTVYLLANQFQICHFLQNMYAMLKFILKSLHVMILKTDFIQISAYIWFTFLILSQNTFQCTVYELWSYSSYPFDNSVRAILPCTPYIPRSPYHSLFYNDTHYTSPQMYSLDNLKYIYINFTSIIQPKVQIIIHHFHFNYRIAIMCFSYCYSVLQDHWFT